MALLVKIILQRRAYLFLSSLPLTLLEIAMKKNDIEIDAKTMRVIVVGDGIGLPNGYASTSRFTLLAAALDGSVKDVEIFVATPSEFFGKAMNDKPKGMVKNIKYQYALGTIIYSKHSLVRRIQSALGILYTAYYIIKNYRHDNFVILAYVFKVQLLAALSIAARLSGGKLVLELCEWQEALPTLNWHTKLNNKLFSRYATKMVDGAICISDLIYNRLKDTKKYKNNRLHLIKIPILCDTSDFSEMSSYNHEKEEYIMFSGSFSYEHTILFILESFSKLLDNGVSIKLYISGGSYNPIHIEKVKDNIAKLNLTEHVKLLGFVDRSDLINYYKNARCLLIPLFDDEVSNARFPTKLAEYLLSGVPVVTNNVGEVGEILKHGISAYMTEPGNTDEYALTIQQAMHDSKRLDIARQGKQVAMKNFEYKAHSKPLTDMFVNLFNHFR